MKSERPCPALGPLPPGQAISCGPVCPRGIWKEAGWRERMQCMLCELPCHRQAAGGCQCSRVTTSTSQISFSSYTGMYSLADMRPLPMALSSFRSPKSVKMLCLGRVQSAPSWSSLKKAEIDPTWHLPPGARSHVETCTSR